MKRFIFAIVLIIFCVFSLCIAAKAEEAVPIEETVTGGEVLPEESEPVWEDVKNTISDKIVNWILPHIEEISVIITLILSIIYNIRRNRALDKSVGTLNNNAITIAQSNAEAMSKASGAVIGYQTDIKALLEAFKTTAEDKQRLEGELVEIKNYLHTATKSNLEFADELAELLGLANIPNYKKEEIGARHLAAKKDIIDAEAKAEALALLPASTEEVKENVGEEA